MRKLLLSGAAMLLALGTAAAQAETVNFDAINFDNGWLFHKGDTGAGIPATSDDSGWTQVNLPDDWSIRGPFAEDAPATGSGGWLPTGVVWYRKHFTLPAADAGKDIAIRFDGVMERSGVWINGHHFGFRPSGYATFQYDLTRYLKAGDNVIAVRADTSQQPASRWYAGGGIYRHVRLIAQNPVHLVADGTAITTPVISAANATVAVSSEAVNTTDQPVQAHLEVTVTGPDGQTARLTGAPVSLVPGATAKLDAQGSLAHPHLWSLDDLTLYTAQVRLVTDADLQDESDINFGIRNMEFRADTGFWLNGKNIKLKGVAIHADGGAFGMAVPLDVYERRLSILKSLGVNAIRTAHHPFSPEFLSLCDRMGFVVMDEAFDMWTVAKNPEDYHQFFSDWSSEDARTQVRRDRNHPAVAIWSIGNEIHDTPDAVSAKATLGRLRDIFHAEDPTRPVTQALFRPNVSHDYDDGLADMLDVIGQNYRENELAKAHADKPSRKIIGTENTKDRGPWVIVRDNPAYSGMFLWTGIDYLGEADRLGWPYISNPSGLIDRDGVVKPVGMERASWWSDAPYIGMARRVAKTHDNAGAVGNEVNKAQERAGPGAFADWTPADLGTHSEHVEVYSNAPVAELFLNGKSLGKQPIHADASARVWEVSFAPGTLKAIAYDAKGRKVATSLLQTAGAPAGVKLISEEDKLAPGFDHIGFIRAEVVDAKGIVVPRAEAPITVTVGGAGQLAAFDNGSPTDHTMFDNPTRAAYNGQALIMVRATGTNGAISVTASSPGLNSGTATLSAESQDAQDRIDPAATVNRTQ
ncbi:glycoside hydrolase family 2 TIM barrel-domain containing protein [Asticcacaulis sp. EMRT-3]|uniref:glycoside hydrolase family 2 protein n=1 Tax=Asticcacaulis sp. EMRT-3 TaxID=3040349 RepID=UPI0024AF08C5|nr:glycoside hydrolase family 2 TIM barrel-domain containing protein [Asticcacaulis sp. EMRT-3]MDI7776402.1 glycoside hydrolase family 2 TIM barrel-domain containing protein [Asticcacaulis sp. EMRT-3]